MANVEIIGRGCCPLHRAKTEIRQEVGFSSTNATTTFERASNKISKEKAVLVVAATNAQISPEQFKALQKALGQEVEMQFSYHRTYSDEEPSTNEQLIERYILKDVSYVRDPNTTQAYLAFFRTTDRNEDFTYFPYWSSENAFGDCTEVQINSLKLHSGEELWRFDHPRERVGNIIQAIKDHSESMLALVQI